MKKRQRPQRIELADGNILPRIYELKADHPCWGYRRVWAYLRYRQKLVIGKNRVYRILKEHGLLAVRAHKLRACRKPGRSKPQSTQPNKLWGIDMTKIAVESWGWVYLHLVKDWGSKQIVGWQLSTSSRTHDWLEALQQALNQQFPQGICEDQPELELVSDNGCQPTSTRFIKACSLLGIKQIFTSYSNPKGNADTERTFRSLKEDLIWLHHGTAFSSSMMQLIRGLNVTTRTFHRHLSDT